MDNIRINNKKQIFILFLIALFLLCDAGEAKAGGFFSSSNVSFKDSPFTEIGNKLTEFFAQEKKSENSFIRSAKDIFLSSIAKSQDHYKTEYGEWDLIDTEIIPAVEGNYDFNSLNNEFKVFFKKDSQKSDLIKFQMGESWITFTLSEDIGSSGLEKTQGHAIDNAFMYPNIYSGIDVRYSVFSDHFLEEYIIYKPETGENIFSLGQTIKLNGVFLEEREDGSIKFFSQETGEELWFLPTPYMYESHKTNEISYGLYYEIKQLSSNSFLIEKVLTEEGRRWLLEKDRNYPVIIDYTIFPSLFKSTFDLNLISHAFAAGEECPAAVGDFTWNSSCIIPTEGARGVVDGNLSIGSESTITLEPNSRLVFTPGYSITINGSIVMGSGTKIEKIDHYTVVSNSASGQDCDAKCSNIGEECAGVGQDDYGTDGFYWADTGCDSTCDYLTASCGTTILSWTEECTLNTVSMCCGVDTNWTNCLCFPL